MKRTPLRRRTGLRARSPLKRTTPLTRSPALAASEAQRRAVAGRPCIVCGAKSGGDPVPRHPQVAWRLQPRVVLRQSVPRVPPRVRHRPARSVALLGTRVAGAARACRRACGADRRAAEDQRQQAGSGELRTTLTAMAVTAKKLDVRIGDLVEIAGRYYEVVSDKQGGVAPEPAIRKTVAEILDEEGLTPLSTEIRGAIRGSALRRRGLGRGDTRPRRLGPGAHQP
jgi:hypothetical protein